MIKNNDTLWYGQYGGCFVADAFSLECDKYYDEYKKIVREDGFEKEFEQLKAEYSPVEFKLLEMEDENLMVGIASENLYSIIGTILLAKYMKKEKVVCGTRYTDEAMLCAKLCKKYGLKLKMFMSKDISSISSLMVQMKIYGVETETRMCEEIFNLPEMYAFQTWIAAPQEYVLINCRNNVGAFPHPNIVSDFATIYGDDLKSVMESIGMPSPERIVVPIVSGSFALGVFRAFDSKTIEFVTAECDEEDDLQEELDSYCGTFTKVMRNRYNDRVLAPELSNMFDNGEVLRKLGNISQIDTNHSDLLCSQTDFSVQSLAGLYYSKRNTDKKLTLCLVRNNRWGSVL